MKNMKGMKRSSESTADLLEALKHQTILINFNVERSGDGLRSFVF